MNFLAVHGHFYQPPRENPWLEEVEAEDGAAPFHDWNERITSECYAPNTAARRVNGDNRIIGIVNNLERISFNFGPTLLCWLESHHPETYAKILEADRLSRASRGGHGNALAQVYHHLIMPLASRRDKVTQVRWGIADFRHRFGRDPEGMWLPETAADKETLTVLAEHGLKFTILAPSQARRVRPLTDGPWTDVEAGGIDPSRAYRYTAGPDRSLTLFFYDGPISRAVAFEGAASHGDTLRARLLTGVSATRTWPQLVHCATDGESYGHHTRFGDMALAAALEGIEGEGTITLTNYGAFLAAHPPSHQVEIAERTSWSCAHGVERWRSDCGCRVGHHADWHQRWRAPLRETLDWLRDQLDPFYEARLGTLVKDPWAARDDYIRVLLDRSRDSKLTFLSRHQRTPLDDRQRVEALTLLELQRQRLLVYTSDGWFFDEISGLEAVQLLKYAARAMQLADSLGFAGLEEEFLRRLAAAPSNVPKFGNGAEVYRQLVPPAVVDARRCVAHFAISGLLRDYGEESRINSFRLRQLDTKREATGGTTFMVGRVRVESEITDRTEEAAFAVLHFGGQDFHCSVREFHDPNAYDAMKADLLSRYLTASLSEVVRGMDHHFPGSSYSLQDLFRDERRRILSELVDATAARYAPAFQRIWEENRRLIHDLREAGAPVPDALRSAVRYVFERQATRTLVEGVKAGTVSEEAPALIQEARGLGLELDLSEAAEAFRQAMARAMEEIARDGRPETLEALLELLDLTRRCGLPVNLWRIQNLLFDLWRARPERRRTLGRLAEPLGFQLEAG